MNAIIPVAARVAAADDAQRLLLCAVLSDALNFHYAAMDTCPACVASADGCPDHQEAGSEYRAISAQLEDHLGTADRTASPPTEGNQLVIRRAIGEALAWRSTCGTGAEDAALAGAYQELASQLGGLPAATR